MIMEILSKSKNKLYDNNNIFTNDNYKFIFNLKMNKIKEEIKDYIIDKYRNKIIEQNKEINNIKKQLEDLTKKYISIIKLMINKDKNTNYINIEDNDSYKKELSNYINNNNTFFLTNNNQYENIINNKSNINEKKEKINKDKKPSINNLKNNFICNKIKNRFKNKNNNNNDLKKNKINYLKELNKKDLKKIKDIRKEIKKTIDSNNNLNNDFNNTMYCIDSKNKFFSNKTNQKGNEKIKIKINKNRNKKNENIIINYLTFNTENKENIADNKSYKKINIIKRNTGIKKRLLSQFNGNCNNFTMTNLTQDYIDNNKFNLSSQKSQNYIRKLNGFKTFYLQFRKINDSFKRNSIDKSEIVCNPIFGSFLDRIEKH